MAFFPRTLYGSDQGFTPLFRLLDDFDTYSRQSNGHRHSRGHVQTFQPRFDVRETENGYELHGELAGMDKKDVQIDFTDAHTMVIRGRIARSYTAGTPPAGVEDSNTTGKITEGGEESANTPRQATVEDENEGESTAQATPASTNAEVVKQQEKPSAKEKYWVSERTVGEFSRSFNFPTPIQQDAVSANLKDGILNITVPKAKKPEVRRIEID